MNKTPKTRRKYSPALKTSEALKDRATLSEFSAKPNMNLVQITQWKKQLSDHSPDAFIASTDKTKEYDKDLGSPAWETPGMVSLRYPENGLGGGGKFTTFLNSRWKSLLYVCEKLFDRSGTDHRCKARRQFVKTGDLQRGLFCLC
jgi:hypothetical protein